MFGGKESVEALHLSAESSQASKKACYLRQLFLSKSLADKWFIVVCAGDDLGGTAFE